METYVFIFIAICIKRNYDMFEHIAQVDGNTSLLEMSQYKEAEAEPTYFDDQVHTIQVHISQFRNQTPALQPKRKPVRKTVQRNNLTLQSMQLPVIMNINPRSIDNKTEEFYLLLEQYSADLICISESWERDDLPLDELFQFENYKIITNVKQCDFKGGKPAIIVNEEKFYVKPLCPDPISVPVGVECV